MTVMRIIKSTTINIYGCEFGLLEYMYVETKKTVKEILRGITSMSMIMDY